ncbi:NrtA/SsuA/CpmA family ABC transporter substrate-binding protein [Candidatus Woesearchaeota archaeon]|nr:NrtA/SsuA/CpmA family ABC transporter substrate-binding protein [Candidatus Woesearchaeota archaeon]
MTNKKIYVIILIIFFVVISWILFKSNTSTPKKDIIHIGWQPPWVNQGQIAAVLQNTNILAKNNITADFIGFSFGPPMTEAALSGRLDILFAGDQPAFNLILKDSSWKIIAPLTHYRSGILVPLNSKIKGVKDLKGKTIATGIGSTTYRDTLQLLEKNGLSQSDVKIVNLDVGEHLAFLERGTKSWQDIDALATYDPTLTLAEHKGIVRLLIDYRSLGVVIINQKFYEKHPETVKRFLKALVEAFNYYSANKIQANKWYSKAARYTIPEELFDKMGGVEPRLERYNSTSMDFDKATLRELESHLDTAIKLKLIKDKKIEDILIKIDD